MYNIDLRVRNGSVDAITGRNGNKSYSNALTKAIFEDQNGPITIQANY